MLFRSMCKPSLEALSKANGLPVIPLYTHPKEWVGLTEEEQRSIFLEIESGDFGPVVAMIEDKLKEKNT